MHRYQAGDDFALLHFAAFFEVQNHLVILRWVAYAVNRRYGGDNHHIAALHQAFGGRQTHLLDVFVDAGIFFNEQIAAGHIGFGLVVIVVRHEILHRAFRKKAAHFGVQLGCQGFVVRHDDGRAAHLCNHIGHGVSFARTCHAQQGLVGQPIVQTFYQARNRRGLVACWRKRLVQFKRAVWVLNDFHHTSLKHKQTIMLHCLPPSINV